MESKQRIHGCSLNHSFNFYVSLKFSQKVCGKNFAGTCTHTHTHTHLYLLARAAIRKYQRLAGLNDRNVFLIVLEGNKQKIKVPTGLVSSEVSPWFAYGCLLPVSSKSFSLCVPVPGVSVLKFPLLRTPIRLD